MSQVGNTIKMFILLQSRGKLKAKEIAEELEISERWVRKYRSDLEQAGIYIDSISGKNGGYTLQSNCSLFNIDMTEEESIALLLGLETLKHNNFLHTKEIQSLVDKLNVIKKQSDDLRGNTNYFLQQTKPNCDVEFEKKKIAKINEAIITKRKINMEYNSLKSGLSKRIVRPYVICQYKGDMYMAGFCEERQAILDFKIIRIKNIEIIDEKFDIPKDFSLKNVLKNCIGIYKDKEIFIKLKITKPMSYIVSEKIWVDNQKIRWGNNEEIIFEANMKGVTEIKSWILSMGKCVEVLEPISLRDEIINEIKNLQKIYKF